jgi:hypothetical protein
MAVSPRRLLVRTHRSVSAGLTALIGLILTALSAQPAWAGLGGNVDSVEADRTHMAARLSSVATTGYTVHTLSLPNGGVTKEFAGPDGVVFAITWHGAGRPDLRQLLGDRFAVMQSDNATANGRRLRRPLSVNRSDFVVRTGGHPGAFSGLAYLPQLVPQSFSFRALQ